MSILRSKHSGWTHESTRTPFFGGGGGGGPTQTTSTSQTSNIPDYAQPYVENMLESTQRQIYTTDPVTGERTGFKPYVPYSRNASDYVAPFQPMQVAAQQGIANLQVPGEYKQAIGLTGLGTMGSMGLAGQGVSAAQQGFGAGQQYANQMQDPASMASYMNPYQQGVTDVAKAAAVREAQIAQSAGNLGAARQGTYGGARQTLANAERERNLLSNLSNIQAQGSNQAYQQAVANQQFGANLGLQGLQAGYGGLGLGLQGYGQTMQGAGQIGQLGGAELKAQQDLYGLKNQYGGQQQAQEQQKISQAIQDFANQQQYPLMQLGTMSNMLRGLPMQSANTNQYVAAPNALTQGIGLAGAGASIYNALKKEGGVIKEMKSGGITSIPRYDVGGSVRAKLEMMSPKELQEYKSGSPAIQEMVEEVLRDKTGKAGGGIIAFANPSEENNQGIVKEDKKDILPVPKAAPVVAAPVVAPPVAYAPTGSSSTDYARYISEVMGSDIPDDRKQSIAPLVGAELARIIKSEQPPVPVSQAKGVPAAVTPTPAPVATPAGILQANPKMPPIRPVEETQAELDKGADERVKASNIDQNSAEARKGLTAERANAADEARRVTALRMAEFFGAWGSTPGNTIVAGLNTLKNKVPDFVTDIKEATKIRKDIDKDIAALDKLDREEKRGIRKDYFKERSDLAARGMQAYGYELSAYSSLTNANIQARATMATANKPTDQDKRIEIYRQDIINRLPADQRAAAQKDPKYAAEAQTKYLNEINPAGGKLEISAAEKYAKAIKDIDEGASLRRVRAVTKEEKAQVEKDIEEEKAAAKVLFKIPTAPGAAPAPSAAPVPAPVAAPVPAPAVVSKAPNISTVEGAPPGTTIGAFVPGKGFEIKDKSGKVVGHAKQ